MSSNHAALLVYEGFSGYTVGNINGQAVSGTGLDGNWTVTNAVGSGSVSSVFQSSGLSFGSNFATSSGGSLLSTSVYNNGLNAFSTATAGLNTSATGTIWSSYLINWNTISAANGGSTIQGIGSLASPPDNSTVMLRNQMVSNTTVTNRQIGVGYDQTATLSGNTSLTTGAGNTYLYISKYTNVGLPLSAGSPGVATTWLLTQSQYDTIYNTGVAGITEAKLNAGVVTQKVTDASVTSGTYLFDDTRFLTLRSDAPDQNNFQTAAVFDELRYGTTLDDVTVIPEPSATALLFGAGMSALLFRRKRQA
jgi:hypothetical protein